MKWIFIDFESFYSREYSLRRMTPYEYILDPRFECIGASVIIDGGEPMFLEEDDLKYLFSRLDPSKVALVSHNALFDMCIVTMHFGFVPALFADTMGMARALIGGRVKSFSLKAIAEYLGLPAKTDVIHNVIGMTKADIIANGMWEEYKAYAINDDVICKGIFDHLLPEFPAEEFVVNDIIIRMAAIPQFKLDSGRLAQHLAAVQSEKMQLMAQVEAMGADKASLMSNEKFADLLRQQGVEPPTKISPTTGQLTYAFAKTDEGMDDLKDHPDPAVQALIAARLKHKSTLEETRTQRFLDISRLTLPSKGQGWMPIPLKYSGAHTHRFSGDWKLNLQNLPGRKTTTLRQALVAPPGHVVLACDASQIEARLTAWLCGQDDLIEQFEQGADVYSSFASDVYGYPCSKKEHPVERFVGKTCLSGETLVYTPRGLVPMRDITPQDKLWDGVEWVSHQGLISNGIKRVLNLSGVWLTPDHQILCGTQWQEAQSVARDVNIHSQALATGVESLQSLGYSGEYVGVFAGSSSAANAQKMNTYLQYKASKTLTRLAAAFAPVPLHRIRGKNISGTQTLYLTTPIGVGCLTVWPRLSPGVTTPGMQPINTMGCAGLRFSRAGVTTGQSSLRMLSPFQVGTSQNLKWTVPIIIKGMWKVIYRSCLGAITSATNAGSKILNKKCEVFDLLSVGSRHRFMIATDAGPLIVHNCILGLGFGMGPPKFENTVRVQAGEQGITINMDLSMAQSVVGLYRRKYSAISGTWKTLDRYLPEMAAGTIDVMFGPCRIKGNRIYLPNGLYIEYHNLRHEPDGWVYDYQRMTRHIYGGKMLENIVQALDRVIVMQAAIRIRQQDKNLILAHQVHDELIYVVPVDELPRVRSLVYRELKADPSWATLLPLDAETKEGPSYGALTDTTHLARL